MYLSRILVLGDEFPKLKIIDFGAWLNFFDVRYSPAGDFEIDTMTVASYVIDKETTRGFGSNNNR